MAAVNLLASVVKAEEMLSGLVEDFKIFNQGSGKFPFDSGVDPDDLFMMGDDEIRGGLLLRGATSDKKGNFLRGMIR